MPHLCIGHLKRGSVSDTSCNAARPVSSSQKQSGPAERGRLGETDPCAGTSHKQAGQTKGREQDESGQDWAAPVCDFLRVAASNV